MLNRLQCVWVGLIVASLILSGCGGPKKSTTKAGGQSVVSPTPAPTKTSVPLKAGNPTVSKVAAIKNTGTSAGVLTADKKVYDFGLIEPSVQQKGKYVLTNTGKGELKITNVRSGCGCTVVKLKDYTLSEGESVDLEFVYNPSNYPGKVSKNIWVDVAPPSSPKTLDLNFIAEIRKFIDVKPERVTFNIKKNADNSGVINLKSMTKEPFKVLGVTCRDNVVNVDYDPQKSATQHELKYTVDMAKLRKLNSGIITITTSNPKARSVRVYYSSIMPVVAHPPTRRFPSLKPGVPAQSDIKVVSNFSEDFELGEISSQKGLVKVLNTQKTSDGYQINIEMNVSEEGAKSVTTRYISDTLLINIKDYPDDVIRVYCYGQVVKN